jgi:hypothetical protein
MLLSYRLYGLVVVLCALLVGAALDLGRRQPAPPNTSLLSLPGCTVPCTFGIVPGTTDRTAAQAAVEQASNRPYQIDSERILFDLGGATGQVDFSFMSSQRVGAFIVYRSSESPTLGALSDLLLAGYQPQRVVRSCVGTTPRLMGITFGFTNRVFGIEDRMSIVVEVKTELSPNTPINILEIRAPNVNFDSALASIPCMVETEWQGFAPLWHYFRPSTQGQ